MDREDDNGWLSSGSVEGWNRRSEYGPWPTSSGQPRLPSECS
jgi:hypothetical protein